MPLTGCSTAAPATGDSTAVPTGGSTSAGALPSAAAAGGASAFATASAFDELAAGYDADFTAGAIGSLLRAAVWRRLGARFAAGDRVLELNCGTGEDAVHLASRGVRVLATDASAAMLEVARRKAAAAGVARRTFFRYFRSKEEAIFPDHDDTLVRVADLLASANPGCTLQIQKILRQRGKHLPAAHPVEILDASISGTPLPS